MAVAKTSKAATIKTGAGNVLRFGLATLPLYPAVKINLDAAAGQGETWAVVGIGFVIFGALAIDHSLHAVRWRQAITALFVGRSRCRLPCAQRHERDRQSRQPHGSFARREPRQDADGGRHLDTARRTDGTPQGACQARRRGYA